MKFAALLLLPRLLTTEPPSGAVKLNTPRVQMRNNEASATRSPWIDANGWRMIRTPNQQFFYQVPGEAAALAAAESFTYGSDALISTDAAGTKAFEKMLEFLRTIPDAKNLKPVADFGVIDDGSAQSGEILNLLTRQNLLFKIEKNADPQFKLNVRADSSDPSLFAHKIRSEIGDDHRSIRIYGSEVVISHYVGDTERARVYLINYSNRPVLGLRVRVKGSFAKGEAHLFNVADQRVEDWVQDGGSTEFSLPELNSYAIIDLK